MTNSLTFYSRQNNKQYKEKKNYLVLEQKKLFDKNILIKFTQNQF